MNLVLSTLVFVVDMVEKLWREGLRKGSRQLQSAASVDSLSRRPD
jgi:hypothetical protein